MQEESDRSGSHRESTRSRSEERRSKARVVGPRGRIEGLEEKERSRWWVSGESLEWERRGGSKEREEEVENAAEGDTQKINDKENTRIFTLGWGRAIIRSYSDEVRGRRWRIVKLFFLFLNWFPKLEIPLHELVSFFYFRR